MGQGWLYGRPIQAAEIREMLAGKDLLMPSVRDSAVDATDAGSRRRGSAA
jgi:hypothetical protein